MPAFFNGLFRDRLDQLAHSQGYIFWPFWGGIFVQIENKEEFMEDFMRKGEKRRTKKL